MVLVGPSTTLSSFDLLTKRKESQLQLWYVHMQAFQSTERKSWRDHEEFSLTGTTKHHSGMTVPNLTSSESWVLPCKTCMGSPSKYHFLKDPGKWRHSSSTASLSIWKTHQKNHYISDQGQTLGYVVLHTEHKEWGCQRHEVEGTSGAPKLTSPIPKWPNPWFS